MSGDGGIYEYTRQGLRKATKFVEGDYRGINPREFYRQLKRDLEEIQEGDDFKYETFGDWDSDFSISSENVGEKTGTVEARMQARSDWLPLGNGTLEYKPYGPHGALGIVVGLVLLLFGFVNDGLGVVFGGLVIGGLGAYGYQQSEMESFPIIRRDEIRILITGEVSERTTQTNTETRTDIFANMSVVYAGDVFVAVETGQLDQLPWTARRRLTNRVKLWYNATLDNEARRVEVNDGFLWQLSGWTERGVAGHRREIKKHQDPLIGGQFEYRERYTELLEQQLPMDLQQNLETFEDELMVELEELANDLEIYVEREGLQHTDRIETQQDSNPALESGG